MCVKLNLTKMDSEILNDDVLFEIALNSDLDTISNFCSSNAKYNRLLCNNDNFWYQKFKRDYFDIPNYTGSWKRLYLNYGTLYNSIKWNGNYFNSGEWIQQRKFKPVQIDCDIALDTNGSVWTYISYEIGWIRVPKIKAKMAVRCAEKCFLFIDDNDAVYFYGEPFRATFIQNKRMEIQIIPISHNIKAKKISAGFNHIGILDSDGNVYTMGIDKYSIGYLGFGELDNISSPKKIPNIVAKDLCCDNHMTMIIDINNNVYGCGQNISGELGLGHNKLVNIPQMIPNFKVKKISPCWRTVAFIDLNDRLYIAGYNLQTEGTINVPVLLTEMTFSNVFTYHTKTLFMTDFNDNLYIMGYDYNQRIFYREPKLIPNIKLQKITFGTNINIIGTFID